MKHSESYSSYQEKQVRGTCCPSQAVLRRPCMSLHIDWFQHRNSGAAFISLLFNDFITPGDQLNIRGFLCHFFTWRASSCLSLTLRSSINKKIIKHNSHHTVWSYGCRPHPHKFCCLFYATASVQYSEMPTSNANSRNDTPNTQI